MSGLARRVDALEQATGVLAGLPCVGCGLAHVHDALGLEWLQARYAGSDEPVPPICGCQCCRPVLDDLVARYRASNLRGAA